MLLARAGRNSFVSVHKNNKIINLCDYLGVFLSTFWRFWYRVSGLGFGVWGLEPMGRGWFWWSCLECAPGGVNYAQMQVTDDR
jgi:hypothetical protein